jgi:polygalacturonase
MKTNMAPQGARGRFVQNSRAKLLTAIAAVLTLATAAMPTSAATTTTNWWSQSPAITIGSTSVNVRNFGAMGNGVTDDTAAFQAAINALPASGGTVVVPTGTYMIDATKSINMRSNTRLSLWGTATLQAIPNNASFAAVVKAWNVSNVEILGGKIEGERNQHLGTNGMGYGISIQESSQIYVHDITLADNWGDGILVGTTSGWRKFTPSSYVTVVRVHADNNRSQGMSITAANHEYALYSSFDNTNGTLPQAGIDIEPQTLGPASQIRIESSGMSNNLGNGVEIHDNVTDVAVVGSTAQSNHGFGIFMLGTNNVTLNHNTLTLNYLFGVDVDAATNTVQLTNNTVTYNGAAWLVAHNQSLYTLGYQARDITIDSTAVNVTQSGNVISPLRK